MPSSAGIISIVDPHRDNQCCLNTNIICGININVNIIMSTIIINIVLISRTKTLLVSWDGSTVIVHFFSFISDPIICFENESWAHKTSINLHAFV